MDAPITTVFYLHTDSLPASKATHFTTASFCRRSFWYFENAVNSKLFCPQHNCVTTPFPADTFLVFSPTNKICEEKAKTENILPPTCAQVPTEPAQPLTVAERTPLSRRLLTARSSPPPPPLHSANKPQGRNWFRSSGAQGLATTNSHL